MSKVSVNGAPSIGLGTLLFLVFLVLKLTNVITWSWWWITAPLWISWLLVLGVIIIAIIIAIIVARGEK